MTREDKAVGFYANGYNCAQAVLGAFCEDLGLDLDVALKLANGFGGGVRRGDICGAASGAIMAIGLKHGFHVEKDFDQKAACYKITDEFIEKFKDANGSAICRELLGINIRQAADHNTDEARAAHKTLCPKYVASAVRVLKDMNVLDLD